MDNGSIKQSPPSDDMLHIEQIEEIASSSSTNQPPTLTASMLSQLTKSWSEESSNNNIIQRQLESLINSNSKYFYNVRIIFKCFN